MKFIPHPYQKYAIEKIITNPAFCLFLDLGMGKTVITLTALQQLLHPEYAKENTTGTAAANTSTNPSVKQILIIAPLRVAEDTWSSESQKWDHLQNMQIAKILGNEEKRIAATTEAAAIHIINRENVEWLVNYHGRKWPYDMVVIDELSSFKSANAKRFKALRKIRTKIKRLVGLTGTPAPNSLIDLWPQIYLLDKGERLGSTLTSYRQRYFTPDKCKGRIVYSYKPKPLAEKAIYQKIADICISMQAGDYLKMPARIDNFIEVSLSARERTVYKQWENNLLKNTITTRETAIDKQIDNKAGNTNENTAVLVNKLLQLANGAVYDDDGVVQHLHDRKLIALEDLLESANGKPLLVFYAYKHDRDRLYAFFKTRGLVPQELNTSADIADWNSGKIPAAVVHPASAGHGLNLQAGGNIIIWFGLTWSLELYQQANGRLYRQGQHKTVIIHHLISKNTIDQQVIAALRRKEIGQDALIRAVKARILANKEN